MRSLDHCENAVDQLLVHIGHLQGLVDDETNRIDQACENILVAKRLQRQVAKDKLTQVDINQQNEDAQARDISVAAVLQRARSLRPDEQQQELAAPSSPVNPPNPPPRYISPVQKQLRQRTQSLSFVTQVMVALQGRLVTAKEAASLARHALPLPDRAPQVDMQLPLALKQRIERFLTVILHHSKLLQGQKSLPASDVQNHVREISAEFVQLANADELDPLIWLSETLPYFQTCKSSTTTSMSDTTRGNRHLAWQRDTLHDYVVGIEGLLYDVSSQLNAHKQGDVDKTRRKATSLVLARAQILYAQMEESLLFHLAVVGFQTVMPVLTDIGRYLVKVQRSEPLLKLFVALFNALHQLLTGSQENGYCVMQQSVLDTVPPNMR